ncbi:MULTISPECIES: hypothetical protein [Methylobacterium]|jgi:hypothetical protein|uniref:Uncharacterized protein n=1 Tax=Methylobacterium aquaticum TaxID=270351 RepID=A0A0C6FQL5_9HYPH|nr:MULTISPECIES: hypothetical protein [Methylobacterium]NGM37133.1 hypothetical protein [Methylobacterium sp. DB0501]BAQ47589.1 hypothetical protein Maq22A_c23125 [Methylobacterium aquaticum]
MSNPAAHLAFDVANRGATIFGALQLSIAGYREQEARRRRDGIYAVADLEMRLIESRAIEEQAVDAAAALDAENARLRRELAAAQAQIAGLKSEAVAYARRAGLI